MRGLSQVVHKFKLNEMIIKFKEVLKIFESESSEG